MEISVNRVQGEERTDSFAVTETELEFILLAFCHYHNMLSLSFYI